MKYDFTGIATKYGVKCSDGRTIVHGAFKNNDKTTVPLVWQHFHDDPKNIVGKAYLEHKDDSVRVSGVFHCNTEHSKAAKDLVKDGTITALSIWANRLVEKAGNVMHGAIREVSLVISGANPDAVIETVAMGQSEYEFDDEIRDGEVTASFGPTIEIIHSDPEPEAKKDPVPPTPMDVKPKENVDEPAETKTSKEDKSEEVEPEMSNELQHADGDKTIAEVFAGMTEEQKTVVYAMLAQASEDTELSQSEGGEDDMKENIFDMDGQRLHREKTLSHADTKALFEAVKDDLEKKRFNTLSDAFMAHAGDYGIDNIDVLFPDARSIKNIPDFIKRDDTWVQYVLRNTYHTPFARIKSLTADITGEEARAKGYIKGSKKTEEVFNLLKRVTMPVTIYKKQKLDRDDIIDITEFDVVAWLRAEMRMMLDEEIARAILIGDGREPTNPDKISEEHIRPIYKDADLYTIRIKLPADATPDATIDAIVRAFGKYKGSGNPAMFTPTSGTVDLLLMKDGIGRRLYNSKTELAMALMVSGIHEVEVMENVSRIDDGTGGDGKTYDLQAIIVNLRDYAVGADRGGQVAMFDDFDIDYNQQKYLIETRISGALIKPYSAIVIEKEHSEEAAG